MTDEKTNPDRPSVPAADVEPDPGDASDGAKADARLDSRCRIRVHNRRHRLTDPSGCSDKAAVDGIVRAGVLRDDSAKYVKEITHSQEKVAKTEPEETIITITW